MTLCGSKAPCSAKRARQNRTAIATRCRIGRDEKKAPVAIERPITASTRKMPRKHRRGRLVPALLSVQLQAAGQQQDKYDKQHNAQPA